MNCYGLLGKNISYSFSRGYFTEKFEREQLNCIYKNFDLQIIKDFPAVLKEKNLKGLNVTIPYKQEVIPYLDQLHDTAKKIGAVNVIKFNKNGELIGYNSDYYGFQNSLTPFLTNSVKQALILGTGGASKAVAYALEKLNITYVFVSRKPKNNQWCYADLNEGILKKHQLIINCTPLGTHPNIEYSPDIPYEFLTENHVLFDLIYNPSETLFLKRGREKDATIINGSKMLELQAEKSWEIWNKSH